MISAQTRPANTTVRVCLPPSDGVTSLVYAAKSGLFERAGLDVAIEVQNSGAAAAAAVASCAYDIGESSITWLLLAHEKSVAVHPRCASECLRQPCPVCWRTGVERYARALDLMRRGTVPLEVMSTHHFGLDQVDYALRMVSGEIQDGQIHVAVTPWNGEPTAQLITYRNRRASETLLDVRYAPSVSFYQSEVPEMVLHVNDMRPGAEIQ